MRRLSFLLAGALLLGCVTVLAQSVVGPLVGRSWMALARLSLEQTSR